MGYKILPMEKEDIPESCTVALRSFAKPNQGLYHTYPLSDESVARFIATREALWGTTPSSQELKAIDDETGKLIAFARWATYTDDQPIEKTVEEIVEGRMKLDLPEMRKDVAREYFTMINEGKREIMGIIEDGKVVKMRKRVELEGLLTDPDYQRRGLGGEFMRRVLRDADQHGIVAYLESTEEGRPLYEKYGFEPVKVVDFKYGDSGLSHQYTFMVRQPNIPAA